MPVEDAIRMQVLECRPESVNLIQSAQTAVQSTSYNTALNSLQTSTGTRIRLHITAINVEHQTGPGSTQRYARLETLYVVGVERKGPLTHYAEAPGHPYLVRGTRLQPTVSGAFARLQPESRVCTILHAILHVQGRTTTSKVQQPQDCTSL